MRLGWLAFGIIVTMRAAIAADVVATFDDLPVGTEVTDQYGAQGLRFGESPIGGSSTRPRVRADASARSGTQVGDLGLNCGAEFCTFATWVQFDTLRNDVEFYAGNYGAGGSQSVTIRAWDLSGEPLGDPVSKQVFPGTGYNTRLAVHSNEGDIAFVSIGLGAVAPPAPPIAIDDLRAYDPVTPPVPQFRVTLESGYLPVGLVQGESVDLPLVIRRANGSTGALQFTLNGLTPGLTATFSPNPSSGGDGSVVTLRLSAARDAAVTQGQLTVGVTPAPTAGIAKKQLQIPFYIQAFNLYDARVTGIEVTQGIQTIGQPTSLPARDPANPTAPVAYSGVRLRGGGKTVVRVFANLRFGPSDGVRTYCKLRGFANGKELPMSPLNPDDATPLSPGGQTIKPGGFDYVDVAARALSTGVFTFTLPKEGWRGGTIDLRAEIEGVQGRGIAECGDQICKDNNAFTLSNVAFTTTGALTVLPIILHVRDVPDPSDPWTVMDGVRTVTPYGLLPTLYRGVIDISDIVYDGDSRSDRSSDALDEVEDWADDNGLTGNMAMGVIGGSGGVSDLGVSRNRPVFDDYPVSVVNEYRPLGSVAHELMHGFDRDHASAACGGGDNDQKAEDWPPDQKGFLGGVGLDTRAGSGGGATPYRVFAAGGCDASGKCIYAPWRNCTMSANCDWFDFMAYTSCQPGGGEAGLWVSPRGWDYVVNSYALALQRRAVASADTTSTLRVRARVSDSGFTITRVAPRTGPATAAVAAAAVDSPYMLVVRDASGAALSTTPMAARETHVHDAPHSISLLGDAPPASTAEQVDVMEGSTVMATRKRSPNAPDVQVTTPRRIRTGDVTIQWQVTDADGDRTTSAVDFSTDDGTTWRPLFRGPTPDPATTVLPRSLFSSTRKGRIRIRANDGFNESAAVSSRFVVPRGRPVVRIESPVANQTVISNAVLSLVGDAHDDAATPIPDEKLRWYVGRKRVGEGREVSVTNLRPGKRIIRLLARGGGKTGKASVTVEVIAPER